LARRLPSIATHVQPVRIHPMTIVLSLPFTHVPASMKADITARANMLRLTGRAT